MRQVMNIKKVSIDNELKVTITLEFTASGNESKENVFELIRMQEDMVEVSFELPQQELPTNRF